MIIIFFCNFGVATLERRRRLSLSACSAVGVAAGVAVDAGRGRGSGCGSDCARAEAERAATHKRRGVVSRSKRRTERNGSAVQCIAETEAGTAFPLSTGPAHSGTLASTYTCRWTLDAPYCFSLCFQHARDFFYKFF